MTALDDTLAALAEPTMARWYPPEFYATKSPVLDKVRQMIRTTPVAGFCGCAHTTGQTRNRARSDRASYVMSRHPALHRLHADVKAPCRCLPANRDGRSRPMRPW